jgi:hypothetical protein
MTPGAPEAGSTDPAPPTALERAVSFALCYQNSANTYALMFGGPVYLVGSMLTSPTPGDIDIRCMITRERAELWFGEGCGSHDVEWPAAKLRLHREALKQSTRLTRQWRRGRVDFQFEIALLSDVDGLPILDERPRIRMDHVPVEMFAAGMGAP